MKILKKLFLVSLFLLTQISYASVDTGHQLTLTLVNHSSETFMYAYAKPRASNILFNVSTTALPPNSAITIVGRVLCGSNAKPCVDLRGFLYFFDTTGATTRFEILDPDLYHTAQPRFAFLNSHFSSQILAKTFNHSSKPTELSILAATVVIKDQR